jgi:hypothetical protein
MRSTFSERRFRHYARFRRTESSARVVLPRWPLRDSLSGSMAGVVRFRRDLPCGTGYIAALAAASKSTRCRLSFYGPLVNSADARAGGTTLSSPRQAPASENDQERGGAGRERISRVCQHEDGRNWLPKRYFLSTPYLVK